MSPATATDLLAAAVAEGSTPGWVLARGQGAAMLELATGGLAEAGDVPRPMTVDTVIDLASLTKVVATLPVILALIDAGELSLSTPVGSVLPACGAGSQRGAVTVEHLLTHTSGLPAGRPFWRRAERGRQLWPAVLAEPLEEAPGRRVHYSDIGFLLLGRVAEAVTGAGLDELFAATVARPLGMESTRYGPLPPPLDLVAATERDADGRARRGRVHDENAAALAVPTGHAGLFGTAADLGVYLGAWTDPEDGWLPRSLRVAALADRTAGLDGHRGLGWAARGDGHDQLGEAWPESAVFHSGFTGTSLALDPVSGRWLVLLTNDVHFGRGRGVINPLRRAVHTAAWAAF